MRFLLALVFAAASLMAPLSAAAQSGDVEATIVNVDKGAFTLELDDGQSYAVPGEFNFEGLEAGVRVLLFYTVIDGERVVDDLELIE